MRRGYFPVPQRGPKTVREDVTVIVRKTSGEEVSRSIERDCRITQRMDGRECVRRASGTVYVERDATNAAFITVVVTNLKTYTADELKAFVPAKKSWEK